MSFMWYLTILLSEFLYLIFSVSVSMPLCVCAVCVCVRARVHACVCVFYCPPIFCGLLLLTGHLGISNNLYT
jgi:hypothetical protein